jgi:phosphate/sulfate permease
MRWASGASGGSMVDEDTWTKTLKGNEMENVILSDFLTGLLGVVLGILLTFGVNHLWRRHEEKKRTKDMLILVRNELINNKEIFKTQEELVKKDGYIYQEILESKNDLASIPDDALKTYHSQIQGLMISPLNISAWQIFQNSEMIQKMTDKEMVIRLTDCYAAIVSWHEFITKDYWEIKKKMLALELDDPFRFFDSVLNNNEMHNFFDTFRLDKEDMWEAFLVTDAIIDYAILLLDKHGDYRYDMEEKDSEMIAFIETRMAEKKNAVQEENEISRDKI